MTLVVMMSEVINLAIKLTEQLPEELVSFMQVAGKVAHRQDQKLYLVGGVVRDLLLKRTNFDLDLVVEGNAINLARELAGINQGKIVTHPRFGTAKLQWDKWSVDVATARLETYVKPGALPSVKSGAIKNDLSRRDFTINAMAIELNPGRYGQLLDFFDGRNDLKHKLIRVLHDKSFIDDATRIWRGLRYEQRLGFQLEPTTLRLLKRDVSYLDTISGDRIRHELELILREEYPEKVLHRAEELGVLPKLNPAQKGNGWLAEKFEQARKLSSPDLPSTGFYLALLAYRLSEEENEQLISYLRLAKSVAQILRDTINIKTKLELLANSELSPSSIYSLLHVYSLPAILAGSLTADSPVSRQHINLYLNKLRYIKPALNGEDISRMGVDSGPRIKEILTLLREGRLDGEITTKKDEEGLVKRWLAKVKR
ncbi:CCA tRNA nucleotidyltransferase [Chloroflexota bacterium]